MNSARAQWFVAVGLVGLLSLGTFAVVSFAGGRLGNSQRLVLSSCRPAQPQGTIVDVTLADRGGAMMGGGNAMMVSLSDAPSTARSGAITFVATNVGGLNHELLVLPAPTDGVGTRAVGSDGKIDESQSLGEASTTCGRGAGQGITPGASSWITLRLGPGNYELFCDEPWHYANGMFATLTVR